MVTLTVRMRRTKETARTIRYDAPDRFAEIANLYVEKSSAAGLGGGEAPDEIEITVSLPSGSWAVTDG